MDDKRLRVCTCTYIHTHTHTCARTQGRRLMDKGANCAREFARVDLTRGMSYEWGIKFIIGISRKRAYMCALMWGRCVVYVCNGLLSDSVRDLPRSLFSFWLSRLKNGKSGESLRLSWWGCNEESLVMSWIVIIVRSLFLLRGIGRKIKVEWNLVENITVKTLRMDK